MKNLLTLILFLLAIPFNIAFANNDNPDFMRSIGKIYVVVGVIVATFIGIVIFLMLLDKKISRLEKEMKNQQK
jgi:CcmD family protein